MVCRKQICAKINIHIFNNKICCNMKTQCPPWNKKMKCIINESCKNEDGIGLGFSFDELTWGLFDILRLSSITPSIYFSLWYHARIRSWNQSELSNKSIVSCSRKQRGLWWSSNRIPPHYESDTQITPPLFCTAIL